MSRILRIHHAFVVAHHIYVHICLTTYLNKYGPVSHIPPVMHKELYSNIYRIRNPPTACLSNLDKTNHNHNPKSSINYEPIPLESPGNPPPVKVRMLTLVQLYVVVLVSKANIRDNADCNKDSRLDMVSVKLCFVCSSSVLVFVCSASSSCKAAIAWTNIEL